MLANVSFKCSMANRFASWNSLNSAWIRFIPIIFVDYTATRYKEFMKDVQREKKKKYTENCNKHFPLSNMNFWSFHHDQLTELGKIHVADIATLMPLPPLLLHIRFNFLDSLLFWCRIRRKNNLSKIENDCRMKYGRFIRFHFLGWHFVAFNHFKMCAPVCMCVCVCSCLQSLTQQQQKKTRTNCVIWHNTQHPLILMLWN